MRISRLLNREPFGRILERTMERFLLEWRGRRHEVRWIAAPACHLRPKPPSAQRWWCNQFTNTISSPDVHPSVFENARREYGRSTRWWLRPAQRIGLELALSRRLSRLLSVASIDVKPAIHPSSHLLFVGGNHKVRLVDLQRRDCYAIRKDGSLDIFMDSEIRHRKVALSAGLPVLDFTSISEDGGWYCEPYLVGTPINRLADSRRSKALRTLAFSEIRKLTERTMEMVDARGYEGKLISESRAMIDASPALCTQREALHSTVRLLEDRLGLLGRKERTICTSISHGDFQPGNVLVRDDDIVLIDWEYSRRRQTLYDPLVFTLASRFTKGLSSRIRVVSTDREAHRMLSNWPGVGRGSRYTLALFLLEDLHLFLEETAGPEMFKLKSSQLDLIDEIPGSLDSARALRL